MTEINTLRIKNYRAQALIKIQQDIYSTTEKAELHIKRTWRDLERIFAETRYVKTETGWRRIIDLMEDTKFPDDEEETEIIDVTKKD